MPKKYRTPLPTAQGVSDPEPRAWLPRERFMLFCRGFGDGAKFSAMNMAHVDYVSGYQDGLKARGKATANFAKCVGYDLEKSMLRLVDG